MRHGDGVSDLDKAKAILKELGERELLEFFNAVTSDRPGNWFIGWGEHNPDGEGRIAPPPTGYDKWLLARHDPADYDGDWDKDAPFVREANCSECQSELLSYAKSMKCPVCGTSCHGH